MREILFNPLVIVVIAAAIMFFLGFIGVFYIMKFISEGRPMSPVIFYPLYFIITASIIIVIGLILKKLMEKLF